MPAERKQQLVEQFSDDLSAARSIVFTDHTGLSTAELNELRDQIKQAGGKYTITKNTLLRRALRQATPRETSEVSGLTSEVEELASQALTGPTATLFSFDDEVTAIKALSEFIQDHEKPTIKGGLLGQELIHADKVAELAKLPSLNELIAQLMARAQSPLVALTIQLNAPIQRLVMDLKEVSRNG